MRHLLTWFLDLGYLIVLPLGLLASALRGRGGTALDHVRRRLLSRPPERAPGKPCLWLHGVSVGEVLTLRQLVSKLEARFPGLDVVVSSTTRAGVDAARRDLEGHLVVSYPLDLSWLVKAWHRRLHPAAIVIVEHDLWPNFLREAAARGVPVALINARLSPRSLKGYRRLSLLHRWPPHDLAAICVQDERSAQGFRQLAFPDEKIHVTGNLKFDNPPSVSRNVREEMEMEATDWLFVAGSTHAGEEEAVLDAFCRLRERHARTFLVLVPRRIERVPHVAGLVEARSLSHSLWSQDKRRGPDVHLVDTVGELAQIAAAGNVVFVGGSLVPVGGHNVIEPAAFGRAVIVGPHYHNFIDVMLSFLEDDAVVVVQDAAELAATVLALKEDPRRAEELGRKARETVRKNCGADARTLEVLEKVFAQTGPRVL